MQKISLNGVWDFQFLEGEHGEEEILNLSFPEMALVPGCFDADSCYFGLRGVGVYRRRIRCAGRNRLIFDGVMLRANVYLDGKRIGGTVHGLHPFSIDFDAGREERDHELTVAVESTYDERDSSLFHAFYDFYAYSGICRNVALRHLPEGAALERVCVRTKDLAKGMIEVGVARSGAAGTRDTCDCFIDGIFAGCIPLEGEISYAVFPIRNPTPWTPDSPNLHHLEVRTAADSLETTFGLRVIGWSDGVLTLNGQTLKLIGYNRHDCHPNFGYAMPETLVYADICRIRNQGCNFIRGSHYEQSEFFLNTCDRLGILVWEESLSWGNRESQLRDPLFCERQVRQTIEMIRHDCNHPCILIWGFMNELESSSDAASPLIRSLANAVHAEDPTRPATFATNKKKAELCLDLVDVISLNLYPGWADSPCPVNGVPLMEPALQEMSDFISSPALRTKPYLISEIGASAICGDFSGLRWSEEYQAEVVTAAVCHALHNPRCSGIALWQFSDTKTYVQGNARGRPRGYNDKGLLNEFRLPKLAWRRMTELLRNRPRGGMEENEFIKQNETPERKSAPSEFTAVVRRFTLLELLVTIAIIAVLAAVLLPGLNSARNRAFGAECVSNLRQIGVALLQYTGDQTFYPWPGGDEEEFWSKLFSGKYLKPAYDPLKKADSTEIPNLQCRLHASYFLTDNDGKTPRALKPSYAHTYYSSSYRKRLLTGANEYPETALRPEGVRHPSSKIPIHETNLYTKKAYSGYAISSYTGLFRPEDPTSTKIMFRPPIHGMQIGSLFYDGHAQLVPILTYFSGASDSARQQAFRNFFQVDY